MNNQRIIVCLVLAAICLAGCSNTAVAHPPTGGVPDVATVSRAASLAFGTRATCGKPDQYQDYHCAEHPLSCNADVSLSDLGAAKNAGCWEVRCSAELGVTVSYGESGVRDFYYCERVVIACSSMTGGCPDHDVCVTGAKRTLAIDWYRTESLPTRGGLEFSCPFHDEDS